jgi:hypothetical protein
MKHKHAEVIKAWADGAEIEARFLRAGGWTNWRLQEDNFVWYQSNAEYRVKPEPKPDIDMYAYAYNYHNGSAYISQTINCKGDCNLKLTYDGETNELKSAEVIK